MAIVIKKLIDIVFFDRAGGSSNSTGFSNTRLVVSDFLSEF